MQIWSLLQILCNLRPGLHHLCINITTPLHRSDSTRILHRAKLCNYNQICVIPAYISKEAIYAERRQIQWKPGHPQARGQKIRVNKDISSFTSVFLQLHPNLPRERIFYWKFCVCTVFSGMWNKGALFLLCLTVFLTIILRLQCYSPLTKFQGIHMH